MKLNWKKETGEKFEDHARQSLLPIYKYFISDISHFTSLSLAGKTILEVGCGPGFMNEHFLSAGAKSIVQLDLSYSFLQKAATRADLSRTILINADVAQIPLKDQSVDLVFSRGSIFFWQNLEACFKEILRTLRPGGTAFLGGGYGFTTPDSVLNKIRDQKKDKGNRSSIPRLNLKILEEIAKTSFNQTRTVQESKRGFWLICTKENGAYFE
jgi:ubiquinone/menaquinone biosynthesis C-methylase UbiE